MLDCKLIYILLLIQNTTGTPHLKIIARSVKEGKCFILRLTWKLYVCLFF